MFDSLRQAFREAVENFRTELNRDQVPEAADKLLRAMERELTETRVHLDRLANDLERVRAEAEREEAEARTCLRREEMARKIGDAETEGVAREFAVRHLRRKDLLQEKAAVLERELEDRRAEMDEMVKQLKEARVKREALTASAGRTGARERLREADDLFSEMDRMAERIRDVEARAAAAEELGGMDLFGSEASGPERPPPSEAEVDARLAELKRRMGRE
jgi:phage shock protein A